ncbi:hypothetical protein HMPREF1119_1841 [Haemophilus parainfluenzae HK2019]|uniref:Uncharacterized protein n=1 Tax=Haemophilus parainfluenzae HK2019 TaxID=1095746 RepID=A0ABP2NXL7_HAEPA|nr:hypothetical protein HMPREF1118_0173 [Haemophilus parainfluenzae HK262]EIJ30661.1 hypothetical protein HMPREF1119_1841 [Haemophilus parainfluenzae HK2019]
MNTINLKCGQKISKFLTALFLLLYFNFREFEKMLIFC